VTQKEPSALELVVMPTVPPDELSTDVARVTGTTEVSHARNNRHGPV